MQKVGSNQIHEKFEKLEDFLLNKVYNGREKLEFRVDSLVWFMRNKMKVYNTWVSTSASLFWRSSLRTEINIDIFEYFMNGVYILCILLLYILYIFYMIFLFIENKLVSQKKGFFLCYFVLSSSLSTYFNNFCI